MYTIMYTLTSTSDPTQETIGGMGAYIDMLR